MSWSLFIQRLADKEENKGELPSIIFPYPIVYVDQDNSHICWECANEDKDDTCVFRIVNYASLVEDDEDSPMICDNCMQTIDPALR